MPINQNPWIPFPLASSGTVTNATVNSSTYVNWYGLGCVMVVNKTAESGTTPTLDVKLQGYDDASATWFDVQGASIVQYSGGATGLRYAVIYPGLTADDADGVVTINTTFKHVNGFLPYKFRVQVTHGGTSISNTFSVAIYPKGA